MNFKHDPNGFAGLAVDHPTLALLWETDTKGRPIQPLATFTPKFPGDGFNHTIRLRPEVGVEYQMPCPCGMTLLFTAIKPCPEVADDKAGLRICPKCLSWHSIVWKAPKSQFKPPPFSHDLSHY